MIGWIIRATATVTTAVIIPGRIVRTMTTVDPAAIVTGRIVCALATGQPAFVIPGRTTDADPILLGDRRTGGLQCGTAGARRPAPARKQQRELSRTET